MTRYSGRIFHAGCEWRVARIKGRRFRMQCQQHLTMDPWERHDSLVRNIPGFPRNWDRVTRALDEMMEAASIQSNLDAADEEEPPYHLENHLEDLRLSECDKADEARHEHRADIEDDDRTYDPLGHVGWIY